MRKLVTLGLLLCASCGSADETREPWAVPALNSAGSASDEPATASVAPLVDSSGAGMPGTPSSAGVAGDTSAAGTAGMPSVGGTGGSAGAAGSTFGGTAGLGGPSAAGAAGSGGASAIPFDCENPKPDSEAEWQRYTVEPGQCLVHGNVSWGGENVCTENTPDDGACSVECWPYLVLRVGVLGEPRTLAVLPLFGETSVVDCE